MLRILFSIPAGIAITLGLFYFMSTLVTSDKTFKKDDSNDILIDFVRLAPENNVQTRTRELPKQPPEPKIQPKVEKIDIAQDNNTPIDTNLQMDVPKLDIPLGAGGNGAVVAAGGGGSGGVSGDKDVLPLVRISPQYPRKAAMIGQEGWVRLKFDITEAGTVTNVSVVSSEPRKIFDSSARQALLKWKYKPKYVDGKPVPRNGNEVQLDFKLEDN